MKIFQELLKLVLCGFILLTIILTLAVAGAQEVTIYDRDWRVQQRIQQGTTYYPAGR